MSPLWRDRVIAVIESDRIAALRVGRGWRPRMIDQSELSLSADEDGSSVQTALQQLLSAPGWTDGSVDIVLAEHHVRHAVIPTDKQLKSPSERIAFARIVMRQTYGDLANDWAITVSPASLGVPTMATGVPHTLLNAIRASCPKARLRSIQPALMGIANQARQGIGKTHGRLALIEPRRITLADIQFGQWQSIASRAIAIDDTDALNTLLDEDMQTHQELPDSALWLCDLTHLQALPTTGWNVTRLLPAPSATVNADVTDRLRWALT